MEDNTVFSYHYSAPENAEVEYIRKKYLPKTESKLEELKRLDRQVQEAGLMQSLSVGVLSCLCFGLGLCLTIKVIGSSLLLGLPFGIIGIAGMLAAYPIYRKCFTKVKNANAPRILQLAAELSGEAK